MPPLPTRRSPIGRLDQRGIALPLALVGLVAISLLVTAALLTSSTENAISSAQTSAAQSMYEAEGAIQAYVATKVGNGTMFAPGQETITPPGAQASYDLDVARLAVFNPTAGAGAGAAVGYGIYSVRAEQQGGGRSLVAMLRIPLQFLNMNINAGATLGNNAVISGSIDINSTSNLCAGDTADDAIVHADGTTLEIKGQAARNIGNDTSTYAGDREALAEHVLNDLSIRDLARRGDIRFRQASSNPDSVFNGNPNANTNSRTGEDKQYNWGCPAEMATCSRDTDYYPLVVIDAMNADGTRGSVTINGDHGQGMLLVLNGNLRIQGNFLYKGIILVEGETNIHGGGGGTGGAKIEGALLGLGDLEICNTSNADCVDGTLEDGTTDISSGAVIQFNKCAIDAVQSYLNSQPVQGTPGQPTFAWFEVVR